MISGKKLVVKESMDNKIEILETQVLIFILPLYILGLFLHL